MKPRTPYDPAALRRPSLAAVCPPAKGFEVQERLIARATPGGERVRGSGCSTRPGRKGDVRGDLTLNVTRDTLKMMGASGPSGSAPGGHSSASN